VEARHHGSDVEVGDRGFHQQLDDSPGDELPSPEAQTGQLTALGELVDEVV
jgi:hypothetical protein